MCARLELEKFFAELARVYSKRAFWGRTGRGRFGEEFIVGMGFEGFFRVSEGGLPSSGVAEGGG